MSDCENLCKYGLHPTDFVYQVIPPTYPTRADLRETGMNITREKI